MVGWDDGGGKGKGKGEGRIPLSSASSFFSLSFPPPTAVFSFVEMLLSMPPLSPASVALFWAWEWEGDWPLLCWVCVSFWSWALSLPVSLLMKSIMVGCLGLGLWRVCVGGRESESGSVCLWRMWWNVGVGWLS